MELTGTTDMAEKALQLLKGVDFFDEGYCMGHRIGAYDNGENGYGRISGAGK